MAFYEDMGERPPHSTLERRDNTKGYTPRNCYWATRQSQGRNKRNNRLLTYRGLTLSVADWADRVGICSATIRNRLDSYGWSIHRTLTTPVGSAPQTQKMLTHASKTMNITQWAAAIHLNPRTITERLKAGWSVAKALSTLAQQGRKLVGKKKRQVSLA
jgi:hypothetical protein